MLGASFGLPVSDYLPDMGMETTIRGSFFEVDVSQGEVGGLRAFLQTKLINESSLGCFLLCVCETNKWTQLASYFSSVTSTGLLYLAIALTFVVNFNVFLSESDCKPSKLISLIK